VSAEDDIFDAITRHQIFVLRYAKGREREAEAFIALQLEEVIDRLESDDLTAFGRSRAQAQAADLYQYLLASNKEYADQYKADLTKFGEYEADFNRNMMQKHLEIDLSLPAPIQIQQAAFTSIMGLEPSKGYSLGGMLDDFGPAHANLVMDQIRSSVVLGDTTEELTRSIREIVPLQSRKAATLARTAVNHVAVQARKETLKENDDVLLGYEWVATLDSRTSLICMSRDGVIYKDYDNDPKPPAHFNCRSTITPKVNPKFDLGADIVGTRAAQGSGGAGQVSAGLNYDQWLRKQSEPFQDKVLGKSRAKLFRSGMTVDKFVDDRGNTYTLRQLAELDTEFNGMTITEAVERSLPPPPPEPERVNAVLPSLFTTGKNVNKDKLNALYEEIGTPEMAKLQQFMEQKRIKTVLIGQNQMGQNSKSAKAIQYDVYDYLLDDPSPSQLYKDYANYPRYLHTTKRAGKTNGFTSSSYDHIVVKNDTKANFKSPKQIAARMRDLVQRYAESDRSYKDQPWSFSYGMKTEMNDPAGRVATTLLHELGHQVHYFAGFPKFPAHLAKARMTKYGSSNDAESHAEAFFAWVVNRDALARREPRLAEYFDELIEMAIKSSTRSSGGI